MNEVRVVRMLRELRCDPVTQGCEMILALNGRVAITWIAALLGAMPLAMDAQPIQAEGRVFASSVSQRSSNAASSTSIASFLAPSALRSTPRS